MTAWPDCLISFIFKIQGVENLDNLVRIEGEGAASRISFRRKFKKSGGA
jgi:hypothetical protein